MSKLEINTNLDEHLNKAKELLKTITEVEEKAEFIQFMSIKEFAEVAKMSEKKAQEVYNKPDFPSCDYGKEKVAEIHAVRQYFSVPRRK